MKNTAPSTPAEGPEYPFAITVDGWTFTFDLVAFDDGEERCMAEITRPATPTMYDAHYLRQHAGHVAYMAKVAQCCTDRNTYPGACCTCGRHYPTPGPDDVLVTVDDGPKITIPLDPEDLQCTAHGGYELPCPLAVAQSLADDVRRAEGMPW